MAIITYTFDYLLPDSRFATTTESGKLASWTYQGPERLYIGINNLGKTSQSSLVDADKNPNFKFKPEFTTIEFFAKEFPIVASLFYVNYDLNPIQKKLQLFPQNIQVEINDPLPLPEIYSKEDITYNFVTKSFDTPLMESDVTWEIIRKQRNDQLVSWDKKIAAEDMPEHLRDTVLQYRQKLRDIPNDWADYHPAEVVFPDPPM